VAWALTHPPEDATKSTTYLWSIRRYSYPLLRYDSIGFASWNISGITSKLNYEISIYQYSNEELMQVEDSTGEKDTERDTEEETQWPHDPRNRTVTRDSRLGKGPQKQSNKKTEELKEELPNEPIGWGSREHITSDPRR